MTTPDETELLDLIPPEADLVRRIVEEVRRYPRIRRPLLRFLTADDFDDLIDAVRENSDNIKLILDRMGVVEDHIGAIGDRLTGVEDRLTGVEDRLTGVEETVERVDSNVRSLQGSVGQLRGDSYEDKCREQIDAVLDGHVSDAILADREHINAQLRAARHSNVISRTALIDGYNADIIAHARDGGAGPKMLAVVEASVTFNRQDLEGASRRAALIAGITGLSTNAYLVTHHDWPPDMNEAARDLDVTIIQYVLPRYAAYT